MEEMLERILSSPQLAPLFQSGLKVELERTFWTGKGQLGRPDRLVNTPEGWVVLDYKTGKPSKKDLDQVRGYMEAVSGVGTEAVRGLIYYTATDELIAVGT
jgi:CRISPR/Cas system-associated exonuclease Cas4 (RecB family)